MSQTDSHAGWEGFFWTAFERSSLPMALLDEQRRYVEINPAHAQVFGYRREELVGRRVDDFLPENELPTVEDEWREFLETGDYSGERTYRSSDGTVVRIQYAASSAVVTGRQLALYVSLNVEAEEQAERPAAARDGEVLSPREQEVVKLVAMGMTSRQAGEQLNVSTETVRTHIRNALAKTGTRTRAQLVARVLGTGELSED